MLQRTPLCPLYRGLPERSGGWGLPQVCNCIVIRKNCLSVQPPVSFADSPLERGHEGCMRKSQFIEGFHF